MWPSGSCAASAASRAQLFGPVGHVVVLAALAAHALYAGGALDAQCLVARERGRDAAGGAAAQAAREHRAVLDRLAGALGEEREHRVGGVAEQRDAAVRPSASIGSRA